MILFSCCAAQAVGMSLTAYSYRPFLDPLPVGDWWWVLFIPLVVATAVVWKALRLQRLAYFPRQVAKMTGQVAVAIILLAVLLFVVVQYLIPRM